MFMKSMKSSPKIKNIYTKIMFFKKQKNMRSTGKGECHYDYSLGWVWKKHNRREHSVMEKVVET